MEAPNILGGDIDDLKELRTLLENQAMIENNIIGMQLEKQKLEKEFQAEEKAMFEEIAFTVNKRRNIVVTPHDAELAKLSDKLKRVKNEKNKEKNEKIGMRIKEETKDLVLENKEIKEEYRSKMRKDGVSSMWDNKLFMSLFYPCTPVEMLILMVSLVAIVIGIPALICNVLGNLHFVLKTIIVLAYAFIMICFLFFMYRFARVDYIDTFHYTRDRRKCIENNKQRIREIKKKIKHDKDETQYELGRYDEDIASINSDIEEYQARKEKDLKEFEEKTRVDIENDIKNKSEPSINDKKSRAIELAQKISEYEEHRKECAINLSTQYEAYLGSEFMNVEQIDKLIQVMQEKGIATVSEAVHEMKNCII